MIPPESVRKLMKQITELAISHQGIFRITKHLEDEVARITAKALKEFKEENEHREIQGEDIIKRLSQDCIKKAIENGNE